MDRYNYHIIFSGTQDYVDSDIVHLDFINVLRYYVDFLVNLIIVKNVLEKPEKINAVKNIHIFFFFIQ